MAESKIDASIIEAITEFLSPKDKLKVRAVSRKWAETKFLRKFTKIIFENKREGRQNAKPRTFYETVRDADHTIFRVDSWHAIRFILSKCEVLESVKFFYCDFLDTKHMPEIGEMLWRALSLELRYLRQLHLNGLKHLVGSTVELREFAFYYSRPNLRTVIDRRAELAGDIIQDLLSRNRQLDSLLIWDDIHNYSNLRIERPMRSINIMALTITTEFWQSLQQTSRSTLKRYISARFIRRAQEEHLTFENLTDLRLGNLNFIPQGYQFPKLEILKLKFNPTLPHVRNIQSTFMRWTYGNHPSLQVMDVNFFFSLERHFTEFCRVCPQMKTLIITIGYTVSFFTVQFIIRFRQLEVLCIHCLTTENEVIQHGIAQILVDQIGVVEDEDMKQIVENLPTLRVLICDSPRVGRQTYEIFAERAQQNPQQTYFIAVNYVGDYVEESGNLMEINEYYFFPNRFRNFFATSDVMEKNLFDNFDYFLWKRISVQQLQERE